MLKMGEVMKLAWVVSIAAISLGAHSLAALPNGAPNAEIDEAVKTLAEIPADKGKHDPYCALLAQMYANGLDQAKSDTLDDQFDDLLRRFGPKFAKVVELSHQFEDASPEGQALNAGFDKVNATCKK